MSWCCKTILIAHESTEILEHELYLLQTVHAAVHLELNAHGMCVCTMPLVPAAHSC